MISNNKNIFSFIPRSDIKLEKIFGIKITNINFKTNSYNINNNNNKIHIIYDDIIVNESISPGNYEICDLVNVLNEKLDNLTITWTDSNDSSKFTSDSNDRLEIKYIDLLKNTNDTNDNNKNETPTKFEIKNSLDSIFRILGFHKNNYSDKLSYVSEIKPNLPDEQPLIITMIINKKKAYDFKIKNNKLYNTRGTSCICEKRFKKALNIQTITFILKQSNDQLYDCENYIKFNIELFLK